MAQLTLVSPTGFSNGDDVFSPNMAYLVCFMRTVIVYTRYKHVIVYSRLSGSLSACSISIAGRTIFPKNNENWFAGTTLNETSLCNGRVTDLTTNTAFQLNCDSFNKLELQYTERDSNIHT